MASYVDAGAIPPGRSVPVTPRARRRDIVRVDPDQPRYAHRNARPLELLDAVRDAAVTHGHARAQAHVLGPRHDDEALDEPPVLAEVAEDPPVAHAVASADGLDRVGGAQEVVAVLAIDPVLELDQDRAVVGSRLDGDR